MRKRLLGLDLLANKIKKSKVKKRFSIQGCLEKFNNGRTFAARKMQASATSKRLWRLKECRAKKKWRKICAVASDCQSTRRDFSASSSLPKDKERDGRQDERWQA